MFLLAAGIAFLPRGADPGVTTTADRPPTSALSDDASDSERPTSTTVQDPTTTATPTTESSTPGTSTTAHGTAPAVTSTTPDLRLHDYSALEISVVPNSKYGYGPYSADVKNRGAWAVEWDFDPCHASTYGRRRGGPTRGGRP